MSQGLYIYHSVVLASNNILIKKIKSKKAIVYKCKEPCVSYRPKLYSRAMRPNCCISDC